MILLTFSLHLGLYWNKTAIKICDGCFIQVLRAKKCKQKSLGFVVVFLMLVRENLLYTLYKILKSLLKIK